MVVQYTEKNGKITEVKLICVEKKDLKDGCKLKIPEGITVIGEDAFNQIRDLGENLKIKMPNTVTKIERNAFSTLSIQKIRFSENLKEIGEGAFKSVTFKCNVILPDRLKRIPSWCFYGCYFSQQFQLPRDLMDIQGYALSKATFKERVILPKGVKVIPNDCFKESTFNQGIELSKKLEEIEPYAFEQTRLKELEIPDSVKCMEEGAFSYSSIQRIRLSKSLTYISRVTFMGTKNLKEVEIPHNVMYIGNAAFLNSNLIKLLLHDGLQTVDISAFANNTNLQELQFPQTLQTIGDFCFDGCCSLEKVNFPQSVKRIGEYAFRNCSLTDITLPENVGIAYYSFYNNNIKKLILSENEYNEIKLRKSNAFKKNPLERITVYDWKNRKGKEKDISKRKVKRIGKKK